jgi:hypothetical protein
MGLRDRLKRTKPRISIAPVAPPVNHPNPGDVPAPRTASQKITAEELREFRELIRLKYALDISVWEEGKMVKFYSQPELEEKMRQADAALESLQSRAMAWNRREYFSSDAEYALFKEITRRICSKDGKRKWMDHPPWDGYEMNGNDHL